VRPSSPEAAEVQGALGDDGEAALDAGVRQRLGVGRRESDLERDDATAAVGLRDRRREDVPTARLAELDRAERAAGPLDGELERDGPAGGCDGEGDAGRGRRQVGPGEPRLRAAPERAGQVGLRVA
jgi:hypothetical protein